MMLSFIKRVRYSYFLRSLSSTFVLDENCFSEKWPLKAQFPQKRRTDVPPGSPLRAVGDFVWFYASWVALQGDTRYGLDRVELLRWRPFPVRFTATVETSIARGENWSSLL